MSLMVRGDRIEGMDTNKMRPLPGKGMEGHWQEIEFATDAWVGSLFYRKLQGRVMPYEDVYGNHLLGLVSPVLEALPTEEFRAALRDLTKNTGRPARRGLIACVRDQLQRNFTAGKSQERLETFVEAVEWGKSKGRFSSITTTLGVIVWVWAEAAGQRPIEFLAKVKPGITELVNQWCEATGQATPDLSDAAFA